MRSLRINALAWKYANSRAVALTLRHHLRQRFVAKADAVELAPNLERGVVVGHVKLVDGIGGVEDEVEGEGVWLVPLVLVGDDELLCTKSHGILFLAWAVAEHVDLCAEGFSPHDREVPEASKTADGDLLAGTAA